MEFKKFNQKILIFLIFQNVFSKLPKLTSKFSNFCCQFIQLCFQVLSKLLNWVISFFKGAPVIKNQLPMCEHDCLARLHVSKTFWLLAIIFPSILNIFFFFECVKSRRGLPVCLCAVQFLTIMKLQCVTITVCAVMLAPFVVQIFQFKIK